MFGFLKRQKSQISHEHVSTILRRQVPIRYDEAARSWLGGLPQMPAPQDWPRDGAGAPLHFLAQVCCSDLPAELWNGNGPRDGWLLLFAETQKMRKDINSQSIQVLYIDALGPEREPPEDMPTVRHTMSDYVDLYEPVIRSGFPRLWRKWPVDLVEHRYLAEDDFAAPEILPEELYDQPVAARSIKFFEGDHDFERPLTWRGALFFVDRLLDKYNPEALADAPASTFNATDLDQDYFKSEMDARLEVALAGIERQYWSLTQNRKIKADIEADIEAEMRKGWLKRYLSTYDDLVEKLRATIDRTETERTEKGDTIADHLRRSYDAQIRGWTQSLDNALETRAYIDAVCEDQMLEEAEAQLTKEIISTDATRAEMHAVIGSKLAEWRSKILTRPLEARLTDADWAALTDSIGTKTLTWSTNPYQGGVLRCERGINMQFALEKAVREDILDLYTRGELDWPAARMKALEAALRASDGVPHRMGGLPDPVQGTLDQGLALVFQLGSDRTLGWMWDDLGALYVTMSPQAMSKGRFKDADVTIEGG